MAKWLMMKAKIYEKFLLHIFPSFTRNKQKKPLKNYSRLFAQNYKVPVSSFDLAIRLCWNSGVFLKCGRDYS